MTQVLCVGHSAWDVTLTVADYPPEDAKAEATSLRESGGGPAANAAYLLGKWGVPTAFAGVIGDDSAGERIRREFASVGVDLSLSPPMPGRATPTSIILVSEKTASRTIVTKKSPGPPVQLPESSMKPSVLLFDGHELPASLEALKRYPDAVSILDAGSLREGTEILSRKVDHLITSERFARQILGVETLFPEDWGRAVAELSKRNGRSVVITLGGRGLIHGTADGFEHLPAFPSIAVDTTGAGDLFHGAFAYGLLREWDFLRNLRFASMTASLSVRRPGGRASIPDLEEVERALTGNS